MPEPRTSTDRPLKSKEQKDLDRVTEGQKELLQGSLAFDDWEFIVCETDDWNSGYSIRKKLARSTSSRMPEPRTSTDRQLNLYLVFDDWNSGYSIRKVSLSRRSGKQPLSSDSGEDSEQDSEQLALSSGPGKGAKPLPVFMRVSAQRGFPQFFTSAFGTKIMVLHPRAPLHGLRGVPIVDVLDQTCSFEPLQNIAGAPLYIPVSDDKLFALDGGSFEVLRKPKPSGQPWDLHWWEWEELTPRPPFMRWEVSSYGVQPDGCILVSTKSGCTYIFDTKEYVWKILGYWVFPFTGRGHYDTSPSLKGFVGLSKGPDTLGYLYCCTMASIVTGDTSKVLHPTKPDFKCTKDTVYNKDPAMGRHVSATLVHMRPGKFCLVECLSIDDKGITDEELTVDQKFRVRSRMDSVGIGPQGGRFVYCLKTFSLTMNKGDLKLKHSKVCCYSLPHEARIGTIRQDPVAFWL